MKTKHLKASEVWYQDSEDRDYWHGQHGVMVNTAALTEREFYYQIIRVLRRVTKAPVLETSVTSQSRTFL